ncbi:hypothetical protein BH09ACT8_BH09ACT8_11080 [soil metagenome]
MFVTSHDPMAVARRTRLLVELISNLDDENGAMK